MTTGSLFIECEMKMTEINKAMSGKSSKILTRIEYGDAEQKEQKEWV